MAKQTTFIKLDRNILNWRWMTTPTVFTVFVWMLLRANIDDKSYQGTTIHRGQLITSYDSIADGTGISKATAQRCVRKLLETGEITMQRLSHCQLITICNYSDYQSEKMNKNEATFDHSRDHSLDYSHEYSLDHSRDHQSKNNKNNKNIKNIKEKKEKESGCGLAAGAATAPYGEPDPRIPQWAVKLGWTDFEKFDAWVNQ